MPPSNRQWRRAEIGYCSNVHPGETAAELLQTITHYIGGVRQASGLARMACGLWISAQTAHTLLEAERIEELCNTLSNTGLALVTLNGFPYGNFHRERVKEQVYLPDWSDRQRLSYTLDLARILITCLPEDEQEGTISTLPLGFRTLWSAEKHQAAAQLLCELCVQLDQLCQQGGKAIRVCLEMEPGCVLERSNEAIAYLRDELPAIAQQQGVPVVLLKKYLGVCYDVCHQAVMFESPAESLAAFDNAGITIGKIQLSSALHIERPATDTARTALAAYAEPRYLHQLRTVDDHGELAGRNDLAEALADPAMPAGKPWRVHFHLPLQAAALESPELSTTRDEIGKVLDFLVDHSDHHPHLEVETYTWHVLPAALRPTDDAALINGLNGELEWTEQQMTTRGLLEADNDH